LEDVRERRAGRVPVHLRDAHYPGAHRLGHGDGYVYPHDVPEGWVDQEYRPDEVADREYYRPGPRDRVSKEHDERTRDGGTLE
ncbi:MAG: hypothetical protein ACRDWD_05080, partial [Acidimicrobiia bacterium]